MVSAFTFRPLNVKMQNVEKCKNVEIPLKVFLIYYLYTDLSGLEKQFI